MQSFPSSQPMLSWQATSVPAQAPSASHWSLTVFAFPSSQAVPLTSATQASVAEAGVQTRQWKSGFLAPDAMHVPSIRQKPLFSTTRQVPSVHAALPHSGTPVQSVA